LERGNAKASKTLQVLGEIHEEAARLSAEGRTYREISEMLNRTLTAVTRWFRSPVMLAEVASQKALYEARRAEMAAVTVAESEREREQVRCRGDMLYFAREILGYTDMVEGIHGPLCRILENPANLRATAMMPRGFFKSTTCSVAFPMHAVTLDQNLRVLLTQNTIENAKKKLAEIRGHFENNEKFREVFSYLIPARKKRWGSQSLTVNRTRTYPEATFEVAGVRSRVVSRHYDIIIEDDTAAPENQDLGDESGMLLPTADQVNQAINWHRLAIGLLNKPVSSRMIVVGTRWWERDLLSWIFQNEPDYVHFARAALERDGVANIEGEPVWPERYPKATLEKFAAALGPYFFSALYLNDPMAATDMNFRPEWIAGCYYEEGKLDELMRQDPKRFKTYVTVDLANDPAMTKGSPDYNAIVTTSKDMQTGEVYVRDYSREKCGPVQTMKLLWEHLDRFNPIEVGIESAGYQRTFIYNVGEEMTRRQQFFTVTPLSTNKSSKEARIMGLQPLVSDGKLRIRRLHAALVQELLAFPRGKNDDVIDALSMQLGMWGRSWRDRAVPAVKDANPHELSNVIAAIRRRQRDSNAGGVMDVLRSRKY
jgi:predicted phage terminase large subunit-like protein